MPDRLLPADFERSLISEGECATVQTSETLNLSGALANLASPPRSVPNPSLSF